MQPLPDPVQPTTQNIEKAKINLTNMQRFNDLLYTYTLTKCANGFILLSRVEYPVVIYLCFFKCSNSFSDK